MAKRKEWFSSSLEKRLSNLLTTARSISDVSIWISNTSPGLICPTIARSAVHHVAARNVSYASASSPDIAAAFRSIVDGSPDD